MIADPAWKSALLHKGQDVADLLEELLSGKNVDLASLPVPVAPGQGSIRRGRRSDRQKDQRHRDAYHGVTVPLRD